MTQFPSVHIAEFKKEQSVLILLFNIILYIKFSIMDVSPEVGLQCKQLHHCFLNASHWIMGLIDVARAFFEDLLETSKFAANQ